MTEQEFEKLYKESYKAVYWTAISLLKDKDEAEDVVQDTFITAFNSYDTLKDKDKAGAWVKKIAANKCLNILTRTKTVNVEDEFFEGEEAVGEDFLPDSLVESDEKRKILMDIIKKCLSDDTRLIIILFYFNDMSAGEIAERLNMSPDAVFTRLSYARSKIKKEVQKYEKDNDDKLFAMGIPFLTKLFEAEADQVPFKPMPAPLKNLPASQATSTAAKVATATSAASKGGQTIMFKKVLIGALALTLMGGGGVAVYRVASGKPIIPEKMPEIGQDEDENNEVSDGKKDVEPEKMANPDEPIEASEIDLSEAYVVQTVKYDYDDDTEFIEDEELVVPEFGTIAKIHYFTDGRPVEYQWYDFYEIDNISKIWTRTEDGSVYKVTEFDDGEFGYTKMVGYNLIDNSVRYSTVKTYDDQGRVQKMDDYNSEGELSSVWTYEYNDDGSYVETVTNPNRSDNNWSVAWYNADGKIQRSESHHYNTHDEEIISVSEYIYEDGKLVRCNETGDDRPDYYRIYSYDGSWDGSYTSTTSYSDGEPSVTYTYKKVPFDAEHWPCLNW